LPRSWRSHRKGLVAPQAVKELLCAPSCKINATLARCAPADGQIPETRPRVDTDTTTRAIRAQNLSLLEGVTQGPATIYRLKNGHGQIEGCALAEVRRTRAMTITSQ